MPGWTTSANDNGNSFDFADLNEDGFLDLAVANNDQLGGTGQFKIYYSVQGTLPTLADWASASGGNGSEAVFCDVDGDGDEDLVTGRWWGLVHVYLNQDGVFATEPDWTSSLAYQSVIENIAFADLDNESQEMRVQSFPANGQRRLFYLGERHLQGLLSVSVDGLELSPTDYCYHRKNGWVSLATAPFTAVDVHYLISPGRDMAVSNWDGATYVFLNTTVTGVNDDRRPAAAPQVSYAYPNPFNAHTNIRFDLPHASTVKLEIFDTAGRRVESIWREDLAAGTQSVRWDTARQASGTYLYVLYHAGGAFSGKLTLAK
jgi:hypothetical protein